MATKKKLANKPSNGWPKISQGTHLTVKTFEDGSTELVWDDEQLLKEVKEAIASVGEITPAKAKRKLSDKAIEEIADNMTPKKTKGKKNVSTQ